MSTTNKILTDVFTIVTASPIFDLPGDIYKKTRPTGSTLEDCVIHLIPGTSAKFLQDGTIYVKIFYKDIYTDNTYYEDALKGQAMEQLLMNLTTTLLKTEGYSFEVQSREIYTEAVNETHEHFAILKMNFVL